MSRHRKGTYDKAHHLEKGGDDGNPPVGDDFQQRRHREARRVHENREDDDGQAELVGVLYNNTSKY